MRKIILLSFLVLGSIATFAQKKTKLSKFEPSTMLKTQNDSLTYAFAQMVTNGLKQHLVDTSILQDPAAADYDAKSNDASIQCFIDGITDGIINPNEAEEKEYISGVKIGAQLEGNLAGLSSEILGADTLDKGIFIHSIIAGLKEEKSAIDDAQNYFQNTFQQLMEAKSRGDIQAPTDEESERIFQGEKYLQENKGKEGIVALPSGVQYKIIENGTGEKANSSDLLTVDYEGRLLNGTVFDSSYKRGQPVTLGVSQVIKGWTEVLQLMPEGSKWTVYIPYGLAYGSQSTGVIPSYSTLIFDIKLIKIEMQ